MAQSDALHWLLLILGSLVCLNVCSFVCLLSCSFLWLYAWLFIWLFVLSFTLSINSFFACGLQRIIENIMFGSNSANLMSHGASKQNIIHRCTMVCWWWDLNPHIAVLTVLVTHASLLPEGLVSQDECHRMSVRMSVSLQQSVEPDCGWCCLSVFLKSQDRLFYFYEVPAPAPRTKLQMEVTCSPDYNGMSFSSPPTTRRWCLWNQCSSHLHDSFW